MNWITWKNDRRSVGTMEASGQVNEAEEKHFQRTLSEPFQLNELFQEDWTHKSGLAYSKLDRLYSNNHLVEQIDRSWRTIALDWKSHLSHHRAVGCRKSLPCKSGGAPRGVSADAVQHKDFTRRTRLEYYELLSVEPDASAIRKLVLCKKAMETVSTALARRQDGFLWQLRRLTRSGLRCSYYGQWSAARRLTFQDASLVILFCPAL